MASRTDRSTPHRSVQSRSGAPSKSPPSGGWLRVIVPLVVSLPLLVTACVGDVPEVSANDPVLVEGREVYSRNCVSCHGASGQGGTGSKLSEGVVVGKYPDPADQFAVISGGRNQMPAFSGKLSDAEIDAVVRFTREGL